jgi:hypothetical protein
MSLRVGSENTTIWVLVGMMFAADLCALWFVLAK